MANKNDGRYRDRERRRRQRQSPPSRRRGDAAADQQLIVTLRRALRSGKPIDLLAVISGFLEVTDPRSRDPFDRDERRASLNELIDSFIGTPFAETTAALTVMRTLVADDLTAARISRALTTRRQPLPRWLTTLADARVEPDVWFLTHVLGDGDDYFIGVTLPSGHALTALVYVDHNLGTVVKDAFVIPEPLEDVAIKAGTTIDDPDQTLTRTDPATARAVIERAIEHGARLYPPLQSESWPMCRPLVEWMLRQLPADGEAAEPKEWTEAETAALARDFLNSAFGREFNTDDGRQLLDTVLWFGTEYATGDPLRWSPVTVEMLLADWLPRKIVAEPSFLAKVPALLRAYIRYSHDRLGIGSALTGETMAAVDQYEPAYQRAIRSPRLQGPAALLGGLLEESALDDDTSIPEIMLESLDRQVGGRAELQRLTDEPLPDEPFDWADVPADLHGAVRQTLEACDQCADDLLDVEHRTAMRRFLSRAAVADPALFRRRASKTRGAAAIAWVICRANDTVGAYWSGLSVQDLLAWFDVKGSVSQRAEPLLRANGVDPHHLFGTMALGTPDLLTSKKRRDIIAQRGRWLNPENP